MDIDITGWVEAYEPYNGEWLGFIRIDYLVGRTPDMFALLFGVGDRCGQSPVAPDRGIPTNISNEVFIDRQRVVDGRLDDIAPTWVAWSELRDASIEEETTARAPSWKLLFDLMEVLSRTYGDGGVRLVVWFRDETAQHIFHFRREPWWRRKSGHAGPRVA